MAILQLNFPSKCLGGNTNVSLIMPEPAYGQTVQDFYVRRKKYPVLWLLHGTTGDHTVWLRKSCIERYALQHQFIAVMPSVLNTNYADWDNFATGYHAYQYLTEELMPLVYSWFPASDKREDNYIAGNSMGGRGACLYAFNHPQKFAAAYIFSAAPQDMRTHLDDPYFAKRNKNLLESMGGMDAYLTSAHNLWDLTRSLVQADTDLPQLHFTCGTEDMLAYDDFKAFREYARSLGLKAQFRETEGLGHEWLLWDQCIRETAEDIGKRKH